jgi:hypothetical protein
MPDWTSFKSKPSAPVEASHGDMPKAQSFPPPEGPYDLQASSRRTPIVAAGAGLDITVNQPLPLRPTGSFKYKANTWLSNLRGVKYMGG